MTAHRHRLLIWATEYCPWQPSCDLMGVDCRWNGNFDERPYCPREDAGRTIGDLKAEGLLP